MLATIAGVAIDKAAYGYDILYRYEIPPHLQDRAICGSRVLVPFGKGNRKRIGIILTLEPSREQSLQHKIKPIADVVEEGIVLSKEMLTIVSWLKEHTFCTYFEAVRTVLPSGLNVNYFQRYILTSTPDAEQLTDEERALCSFLLKAKTQREFDALLECGGNAVKQQVVDSLLSRGIIAATDTVKRKVGDETVRMVRLSESYLQQEQPVKLTPKQRQVVDMLEAAGAASIKEVCYICGVTEAVIRILMKSGVLEQYEYEVLRSPHEGNTVQGSVNDIILSPAQQGVYEGLYALMQADKPDVALLRGITGSGKTSIFLKLINDCIAAGRTAIMLIPEISLTPQMVGKFRSLFGDTVAVIHSSLSLGQRVDEYKRIKSGEASIVVGTRSAVFAPLDHIGIIIMDEEGEHTYKSEASPRYHAREVAKLRCVRHNALLLLASATPCIDSFYYARSGKYKYFELTERYFTAKLPEVFMVDMRPELASGNTSSFSSALLEEMHYNLTHGEQTILLLNRRGYHTYVNCMSCGEPLTCPNCNVALTYHKANGQIMCHYCGYARPLEEQCSKCGSDYLRQSGTGTQRIEDEIAAIFPEARVLRMDADSTGSRYAFEKGFTDFGDGKYDILVGTQMIAKGLDFPTVTLVGVLSVDKALYAGDFRSYERTFSLVTQVVGRSGRGERPGRAYIQTFTPEHYVLNLAAQQNFEAFYDGEIEIRKALLYPPYCDLCVIGFSSLVEAAAQNAAKSFLQMLSGNPALQEGKIPIRALGPAKCTLGKLNSRFRYRLILKCRNSTAFREVIASTLNRATKAKAFSNVSVYADINGDIGL